MEHRPQLRPEDVQRHALKGPEMELHRGALQGPPSREAPSAQDPTSGGQRNARGTFHQAASVAGGGGGGGRGGRGGSPVRLSHHALPVRREVSSADAAMPTASPLFLGGHSATLNGPSPALRSNSLESSSAVWQSPQQQRGGPHRIVASSSSRPPPGGLLPPLSPQQHRGSGGFQQYATASLNGDGSVDSMSVYSAAASEGALRGGGVQPPLRASVGNGGRGVRGTGRTLLGQSVSGSRIVLPAMPPGAPSVNRWVVDLSEEGDAVAGITRGRGGAVFEVNAGREGAKKGGLFRT